MDSWQCYRIPARRDQKKRTWLVRRFISDVSCHDWLHTESGNLGKFCLAFEPNPEKEFEDFRSIFVEFFGKSVFTLL